MGAWASNAEAETNRAIRAKGAAVLIYKLIRTSRSKTYLAGFAMLDATISELVAIGLAKGWSEPGLHLERSETA